MTRDEINDLSLDALARAVELHVFGDLLEANTDERIIDAMRTFVPPGLCTPHMSQLNAKMMLTVWKERERHGPGYRDALEQHVAAWRAAPPRRTVGELLRMLPHIYGLHAMPDGHFEVYPTGFECMKGRMVADIRATGDTPETALMRALLIRHFEREGGK